MSIIMSNVLGVTDRNYNISGNLSDTEKKSDIMVGVVVSNFGMFLCLLMIMALVATYYQRKVNMLIAEEQVYESLTHHLEVSTNDAHFNTDGVTQETNTDRDRCVGGH